MSSDTHNGQKPVQHGLFDQGEKTLREKDNHLYAVMYCDGASSGNPGPSGIGVVIYLTGRTFSVETAQDPVMISRHIGTATNNVAEYTALLTGLQKARDIGVRHIKVFLDSELIVKQLLGIYKVKNRNLVPLWTQSAQLLKGFDTFKVSHVRRELNAEADALARDGSRAGKKFPR